MNHVYRREDLTIEVRPGYPHGDGSGRDSGASFNAKRARCPACGREKDLTGAGKIKKHMRLTTTAKLRKGRKR